MNIDIKLCKCGCGKEVRPNRTYISGHNKSRLGSKMSEEAKIKIGKRSREVWANPDYKNRRIMIAKGK